jgi:hypothetical protein
MRFKVKDGSIVEDKDAPQAPEGARRPVVRLDGNGKLVVTFPFGWNGDLDIVATQDPAQTDKDLSLVEPGDLTKRGYPIDPPKLNWEPFQLPKAPEEERPAVSGGFGPSQEELEPNDEGPITFMGNDPPLLAQTPLDEDDLWERGNF